MNEEETSEQNSYPYFPFGVVSAYVLMRESCRIGVGWLILTDTRISHVRIKRHFLIA